MTMMNLATEAVRLPWALSVFGAQQLFGGMASAASASSATGTRTLADLYSVAKASQVQFESNAFLFAAYQIGDQAQRTLTDTLHDALTLKMLDPAYVRGLGAEVFDSSIGAIRALGTADARRLTLEVAKNKFEVIGLVNGVDAKLDVPEHGEIPLPEMLEKAYALGDYPALWALEGLGESYARNAMEVNEHPTGLLNTGQGAALAAKSQLMMHAGIGIAFAKYVMKTVNPYSDAAVIDIAVRKFLGLCLDNSQPEYLGAAVESLGLVSRTWHGHMVKPLSESLSRIDPDAREFFWHGAGRSMFFHPLNMIPGFSAWKQSEIEPPDEAARLSARAGVAWAFSLVNMRQPEIVANALLQYRTEIFQNDGFSSGIISTIIMGGDMVPNHKYLAELCAYRPAQPDAKALWNRQVGADVLERTNRYRESLRASGKLGEVFRYHKFAEFAAANQAPAGATA